MRELKRNIARNLMKLNRIEKINKRKPSQNSRSYFSLNWRNFVELSVAKRGRATR